MREIGSFSDWTAVPLEAVDGDVVVVRGQRFVMMGGRWHPEIPMPGYGDKPLPPAGVVPPPMPPGPAAGHRHPHVVDHYGDLRVHGDVAIGGKLRVQEIRQPNMGLYKNYESLVRRYPHPCVGMWAVVGDSVPGRIYRCERDGYWLDTGTTGGGGTFDVDEVRTEVEEALGAYDKDLSDLQSALNNEAEVRQGGDMALQARVADLQATDDELKKIVRGDETVANAWKNPFVDLGNYATQGEVNAKLNSVYHSNDMKYNGLLRISRNGAVMQVSQHGIKTTGDEWYWAQCVAGMVQPSNDGTALDASQKFGICVRWTDYLGNATPWQTYAGGGSGDIQLKTINGQSLKGEGNIEISAEGSITIDDVVSETSANAVSSRAVAHAIADVVNALQALVSSVRSDVSALDGRVSAIEAGGGDVEAIRTALNQLQNAYTANKEVTDQRLTLVESKTRTVRECVGAFVGIVPSATVQALSHSGSGGEIVYVQNDGSGSPQFAKRVAQSGGGYVYYNNWDGATAFKDYSKGTWWTPREDSVYIDTAADKVYTYDASTMSLKQVTGGSTAADTTLDINSKNAVANSAVARVLNTQQTAITNLQADIDRIDRQGVPSKVQGDEVTVSGNADGGSAKVRLADIKTTEVRGESQEVVKVRSVGTTHVTDASMPNGSGSEANMRYKLYNDVTAGNSDAETITLAAGSKLEPAGGVPGKTYNGQGEQITVEGGELSWVHSSDIGMIQDGQLPTGMTRAEVGTHNAGVLRMVAASRWNLILDGTYYVNVGRADGTSSVVSGDEGRRNARLNAVIVSRPLRIRGGGLIAERYLFCVEPGGGLVMEDVMLDNLSNYQMIYVDADGALVDSVELYRCSLKTSASPTGTDKYAKNGRFIGGKARNAGNVDTVNDLMPNGLSKQFNTTNCKTILGMSDNGGGLKSRFGQKSATATEPSQLLVYPLGQAFPGDSESSRAAAECAYDMWSQLYVPQAGGGYVFKERSGSTTKHFGMYGDFVPTPDDMTGVYKENGEVVYYAPMYVHDTYENGTIIRGANPEVEHNGLRRLIIEDCTVMCQSTAIEMGGMEVTDEFRIHGCRFYNILALAVNFGTSNDEEAADDWASRSCPLEVSGNTFKGPGEMHVPSSSTTYACALLYEGDKVVFADNVIEDIVTTTTTYDCYLSCNNLEYRGNVIRNVLNWQTGKKLYGYMKAKKEKINAVYRARWRDTPADHPMKMSRVYEGNRYEVNLKDVRRLCDWYMEENRASLLPDYPDTAWDEVPQEAKDGVLREKVLKTMFDNIVSTWAFDSYVIRDNVFDWPDCRVDGAGLSGGQARVRRWVFSGNVLKGLSFCNTQADGYDKYLFAIQCLEEGTDVEIVGNRFESKGHEVINLLCANDQKALASLRVEDNTFVECGYRIAQKGRLQGGTYYDGVLVAGKVRIRGNEEAVGLDRGFTGPYYYDATQYFAQKGLPVMYCGLGGEDDITEVWDSQTAGVAAQTGKMVLLPVGKGRFALHSRHLCRPMQKDGDGIPVLNGDCSLSLINSFMLRNSGGTIAPDSKGYAINISYCVRGRWRERKMELRCVPYESVYRGVSVRGVDGVRWVHSRTYPGSGNPSYNKVYYADLAPVEDLGLHFLLIHRSIVATNKNYTNNGAPMIRLALYTDAGGTLNDPGTVITIRVSDIAANVDMPWVKPATQSEEAVPNTIQYGATSLFETFLPKGSALTSAERTALKTADYCLYKGEPDESQGRRSSTLLAADAGWWCVDPGSGQIVTWTGSKWSDEPAEES